MGQTLSHGVYLPNEGERNCYAGLASNWQILNTAVGNIAEKAPLVHTHGNITNDGKVGTTANLPLITGTGGVVQAGAFGTSANTFCEGNDSRLSDARTPVAHTHTKSDVTDLLNSNFIPSANNSYDLGNSSYQWNNVYAKGYYYNGVAWGLDKANVWTKTQNFVGENQGTELSSNYNTCFGIYGVKDTVGKSGMFFTKYRPNKAQGSLISSDLIQYGVDVLENEIRTNNVFDLQVRDYDSNTGKFTRIDVISLLSNANLGNSTNKWKSFNGVNPGALSFPEGTTSNANTTFNPDLTDWLTDGTGFTITAQVTGWLHIRIQNSTGNFAWVKRASAGSNQTWGIVGNSDTNSDIADIPLNVPVVQGYVYTLKLKTSRLSAAIFMCLGNV